MTLSCRESRSRSTMPHTAFFGAPFLLLLLSLIWFHLYNLQHIFIIMSGPHHSYEKVAGQEVEGTDLNENLVGPAPGQVLQAASSTPMIQVTAPATLPEGYEFEAQMGDRVVKVKVPPGGIEQGQTFSAPMPTEMESMLTGITIPVGHWRDGLFHIFHYGACHPHCWTAFCCTLLAAGQVISRLQLTWKGRPGSVSEATGAFQIIFGMVVLYWVVRLTLTFAIDWEVLKQGEGADVDFGEQREIPTSVIVMASFFDIWRYVWYFIMVLLVRNVRVTVRERYAIPAHSEFEDCCCSLVCPWFVAAQMLRHTTDYDVYPATCCTERGIPPHAPSIV